MTTATRVPSRAQLGLKPITEPKPRTYTNPTRIKPSGPPPYASDVGARIIELAEWRGISRMQLASKAGLHVNAVNKMVNGLSDMRLSTLCSLADALDVGICELLP